MAAKAARKGRIYIDYLKNDRRSMVIVPYSPHTFRWVCCNASPRVGIVTG